MRRHLVVALLVTVVGAGAAYAFGRSSRESPRSPTSAAEPIQVREARTTRWKLADAEVPALVTPEPTAAPTQVPTTAPTSVPEDTTQTGVATIDPQPEIVTEPAPTSGSDTGGSGDGITVGPGDGG